MYLQNLHVTAQKEFLFIESINGFQSIHQIGVVKIDKHVLIPILKFPNLRFSFGLC